MKPRFNTRKSAGLIATAGLSLMLVGAGLSATFTDSGVVSQSVAVGTFKIELASTVGAVSLDKKSVTFTGPAITHSGASSAPMPFTVKNVGSIPLALTIEATLSGASARFAAVPLNGAENLIVPGGSLDFTGGLTWDELVNDDLGRTITVTYNISAAG